MGTEADDDIKATDSQLAERCQELEAELAKLLEVNQEIYDRALEMEERVIQLEAKISDMEEEAEQLTMQLQNSWHLGYKKGVHDSEAEAEKAQAEKAGQASAASKESKPSIKSMIDFELPPEEKSAPASTQQQSVPKEPVQEQPIIGETKKSIKSMIDFELPPEEKSALESRAHDAAETNAAKPNFSTDEGKVTGENPPVFGENEVVALQALAGKESGQPEEHRTDANRAEAHREDLSAPSYNDRVYNAVGESEPPAAPVEAYGGMSWREVETIYQFSASNASGPSLVFEPMSPGQPAAGRTDTQPIVGAQPGADTPILKADAPAPKSSAKPSTTYTSLAAQKKADRPEPPMELTMNQFLGETDSYLSLDRVTLEPPSEIPPPPPPSHDQARSSQEETQTLQGAREQLEAMAKQASQNQASVDTARGTTEGPADHGAAAVNPQSANPFDGRSPAQSFEDRIAAASMTPQPEAVSQPNHSQDLAPDNFIDRAAETMAAPTSSGPRDAKWGKRDANATYDGLNALDSDSTLDVLDLEKLDIFEGLEDIDELSQIEVIEDVIIPAATDTTSGATSSTANSDAAGWQAKPKYKTSEHAPAVSSDDLHDLIKSRIKKAEEPHEQHRVEGFITGAHDKVSVKDAGQNPLTKDPLTKDPVAKESGEKPAAPSDSQTASTTGETAAPPVPTAKELEALRQGARNKFVGGKAASGPPSGTASSVSNDSLGGHSSASTAPSPVMSARTVPPEIRKACMILGVRPEDMTIKEVNDKWKAQMAGGAHPDQGGDTESAIYLNTAKDTLVKWLNDQAPKLGKKFGK